MRGPHPLPTQIFSLLNKIFGLKWRLSNLAHSSLNLSEPGFGPYNNCSAVTVETFGSLILLNNSTLFNLFSAVPRLIIPFGLFCRWYLLLRTIIIPLLKRNSSF